LRASAFLILLKLENCVRIERFRDPLAQHKLWPPKQRTEIRNSILQVNVFDTKLNQFGKECNPVAHGPSSDRVQVINRRRQIQKFHTGRRWAFTIKEDSAGSKTTMGTVQKGPLVWLGLVVLVVLFGLCTVFASVATVAQAWQEHFQARWPEVTARVDECGLRRTSTGRREGFYIRCRLSYAVGTEQHATNIYSRNVPSPEVWQYPPNQIAPYEAWVNDHPEGTPMVVRYDPANHTKIVQEADHVPSGGPRTPNNVKLLEFMGGSFLVLLTIARITRPRSFWNNKNSPKPMHP
jgi:hypothetical protein